MKIKITQQIKDSINELGNKTAKANGLKIYAALYLRNKRKNKHGYFDCPSAYLSSINMRYYKVLSKFLEEGIIGYHKNIKENTVDLFGPSIFTKSYSPDYGYCMKYKFLVNFANADEIEVDFKTDKEYRWYTITKNSLIKLGYESDIKRDSFGRRVHYSLIKDYKTELTNKGLYVIDSIASQPRLLWLLMKNRNIIDAKYSAIFEGDLDFYNYLVVELGLENRQAAKDLFMFWVNSSGYVPEYKINMLFPVASSFIKKLKSKSYKDSSAFLQREEARIWIDDLLENIPVNFALPVHDSLLVRREDLQEVLLYCKDKYPDLRFSSKEL